MMHREQKLYLCLFFAMLGISHAGCTLEHPEEFGRECAPVIIAQDADSIDMGYIRIDGARCYAHDEILTDEADTCRQGDSCYNDCQRYRPIWHLLSAQTKSGEPLNAIERSYAQAVCHQSQCVSPENDPNAQSHTFETANGDMALRMCPLSAPLCAFEIQNDALTFKCTSQCSKDLCGLDCVDLMNDRNHCGECGKRCAPGQPCVQGHCAVDECPSSQVFCGEKCIDPIENKEFCGATLGGACNDEDPSSPDYRGVTCAVSCQNSHCMELCPEGQDVCPDGCANLSADAKHCGSCDITCQSGHACVDGECSTECPGTQIVCNNLCVDKMTDPGHCGACDNACPNGFACVNGECSQDCAAGSELCTDRCLNFSDLHLVSCDACADGYCNTDNNFLNGCETNILGSDSKNCGSCGTSCKSGEACVDGVCQTSCPGSQKVCGGNCVDIQVDNYHCGACGNTCPAGQACVEGACTANCAEGFTLCSGKCLNLSDLHLASCVACAEDFCDNDNNKANGSEPNAKGTDPKNCGSCGTSCKSGEACVDGVCQTSCPGSQKVCGGNCADLQTDHYNCDACGTQCPSGQACVNGTCSTSCASGTTNCGGKCLNFSDLHLASCTTCATNYCDTDNNKANGCESYAKGTDAKNCGSCGISCASGQLCVSGICTTSCPTGQNVCDGKCVDYQTDANNCGGCGLDNNYICSKVIQNSSVLTCDNSTCYVWKCKDDYIPNADNTSCVKCYNNTHCDEGLACNLNAGVCCSAETPYYNSTKKSCVACTSDDHCGEGLACNLDTGVCCSGTTPYYNSTSETCVECLTSAQCTSSDKPNCSNANTCFGCSNNNDCTSLAGRPKCNTDTKQCVECTKDSHCSLEMKCKNNACSW